MNQPNKNWPLFYASEIALFDYLRANAECYYSETELVYHEFFGDLGGILYKPLRYIRWIGVLNVAPAQAMLLTEEMKINYKNAMGKKFKKFPPRFPQFLSGIDEFNISKQDAYQSKLIPNSGMLVLKSTHVGDDLNEADLKLDYHENVKSLKEMGLINADYRVVDRTGLFVNNILGSNTVFELVVPMHEFMAHFGCEAVQRRVFTGHQFRVRMKRNKVSQREQVTLGLMVLSSDSKGLIVTQSRPKAKRLDSLDSLGLRIDLPFDSTYSFYRRANVNTDGT